jgi:hypothetical protein
MKRQLALALGLAAVAVAPAFADTTYPAALDTHTNALYKRMIALNAGLHSYEATAKFDVALKTFPYISPSLDGNVYFKQPDKQTVVFDTVPALASQFKKVYPNVDSPAKWPAKYDIAILSDDNTSTIFRLVPKVNGRVEHLDVRVADADATVTGYTWTYKDGGSVSFEQSYETIGSNHLVQKQTGHVDLPAYKADVSSSFSDYKINVAVADSLFSDK